MSVKISAYELVRKHKLGFFVFVVILVVISFAGQGFTGDAKVERDLKSIFPSDQEIAQRRFVRDFLSAVFQKEHWSSGEGGQMPLVNSRDDVEYVKQQMYPNLWKEFSLRSDGFPLYGGVNKLKGKSVHAIFCWSKGDMPYLYGQIASYCSKSSERLSPIIQASADELNAIGVVNFVYAEHPESSDADVAPRIFIIPYRRPKGDSLKLKPFDYHVYPFLAHEQTILAGVRFTVGLPNQVEGYFVADNNNNIRMAKCFVNMESTNEQIKSYVEECLIRSVGVPNIVRGGGVTGERLEGKVTGINSQDVAILHTLYSENIEAGDDQNEVIQVLLKNGKGE